MARSITILRTLLGFNSLRGRYFLAAAGVAVFVIAGAWLVQGYVSDANRRSTANIGQRNEVVQISRLVRDALWHAEDSLKAYALTPAPVHYTQWRNHISSALNETDRLLHHPWIVESDQTDGVRKLWQQLRQLQATAETFKALRDDPERLFPFMPIMNSGMADANVVFETAATLAIDEAAGDLRSRTGVRTYADLVRIRHLWTKMVSTFRIFVANFPGTFGDPEAGLRAQAADIELLYGHLREGLADLETARHQGRLGFQAVTSLDEMTRTAAAWYDAYGQVRRIAARHWRTDAPMMQETIQPQFDASWELLVNLDTRIEESAARDLNILAEVAGKISNVLWGMAVLGIGFILLVYLYFDRTVLTPVALVARALKSDTPLMNEIELPQGDTEETRNLIDAFTEMRRQVHYRQLALEHQALHDALTGLPNRTLLQDRLQQAVYAAHRENRPLSLIMLDLNRFKEINDTLGHHVGDLVLQQVGARLAEVLRESDTVARLGGDEFALLLPTAGETHAVRVARKIVRALERVFEINGHRLYVGGSLGVALYPEHGDSAQTLIQRADVAMYVAKRNNTGFALYDARQDQHSIGRLALVGDLRNALDHGSLDVYYQPQLEIRTGEVIGMEALLRWRHPELGYIAPDEIIPIAEQTGLIRPLTHWVLNTAVAQCVALRRKGFDIPVAVNLSVWSLHESDLDAQIKSILDNWNLPPEKLELEITESAMMAEMDMEVLRRINGLGIRLAVDDYGTGFSSLAHLKTTPLAEIKIDKSFVMDMTVDDNDAVIVRSTIDLAHNLGRKVVAEGVDTKDIWDLLEILRCDTAQGYYISPPLPAAELESWLRGARQDAARKQA